MGEGSLKVKKQAHASVGRGSRAAVLARETATQKRRFVQPLPGLELLEVARGRDDAPPAKPIIISGKILRATPVFDTYWRFAAKRQALFMQRVQGLPSPWTDDPILASHRFTNVYRASDRVSQYLIRNVLYDGKQTGEEIFFRCLLFKIFNRIKTWVELTAAFGTPTWKSFDPEAYSEIRSCQLFGCKLGPGPMALYAVANSWTCT